MTNPTSSTPPAGSLDMQLEYAAGSTSRGPDVDALWQRGRRNRRYQAVALRGAMLSVVALLGFAAFSFSDSADENITSASSAADASATHNPPGSIADQRSELDATDRIGPGVGYHWHNAFGISVCGEWRPELMSTIDEVGIHSHQDNLIHIHPFFAASSYENATLEVFFEAMQLSVSDDQIVMDNGSVVQADMSCDGEPSVLRLVRWPLVDIDPGNYSIVTGDFGAERFLNDRAGFALIVGPEDAPVEIPPSAALLDAVSPIVSGNEPTFNADGSLNLTDGPTISPDGTFMLPSGEIGEATAQAEPTTESLLKAARAMADFSERVRSGEADFLDAPHEVRTADTRGQYGIYSTPTNGPSPSTAVLDDMARWEPIELAINEALDDGILVGVLVVDEPAAEGLTDLDQIRRWEDNQTPVSLLLTLYPDGSRSIDSPVLAAEVIEALETGPLVDADLVRAMTAALLALK